MPNQSSKSVKPDNISADMSLVTDLSVCPQSGTVQDRGFIMVNSDLHSGACGQDDESRVVSWQHPMHGWLVAC